MKFGIIIATAVLILVVSGMLVYSFLNTPPSANNQETSFGANPFGTSSPAVTGPQNVPAGNSGTAGQPGTIQINDSTKKVFDDVEKNETPFSSDVGVFYELGTKEHATSSAFSIFLSESDKSVQITIREKPVGGVRKEAETMLLKRFNLTEDAACSLTSYVMVVDGVDGQYSHQNLGFSFCPGSVKLSEI